MMDLPFTGCPRKHEETNWDTDGPNLSGDKAGFGLNNGFWLRNSWLVREI